MIDLKVVGFKNPTLGIGDLDLPAMLLQHASFGQRDGRTNPNRNDRLPTFRSVNGIRRHLRLTSILEHEPFGPRAGLTSEGRKIRSIGPGLVESERHRLPAGGAMGLVFRAERIKQKILVGPHGDLHG